MVLFGSLEGRRQQRYRNYFTKILKARKKINKKQLAIIHSCNFGVFICNKADF